MRINIVDDEHCLEHQDHGSAERYDTGVVATVYVDFFPNVLIRRHHERAQTVPLRKRLLLLVVQLLALGNELLQLDGCSRALSNLLGPSVIEEDVYFEGVLTALVF